MYVKDAENVELFTYNLDIVPCQMSQTHNLFLFLSPKNSRKANANIDDFFTVSLRRAVRPRLVVDFP